VCKYSKKNHFNIFIKKAIDKCVFYTFALHFKQRILKRLFSKSFLYCNYLLLLLTGMAYLAPFVSPAAFTLFAFAGLSYSILLIINVLYIFYWLLKRRWYFLFSLLTLTLGWQQLSTVFQFNWKEKQLAKTEKSVQLYSYNVRLFDLYKWSGKKQTAHKILKLLAVDKPEVLCLQEFYSNSSDSISNLQKVQKLGNYQYYIQKQASKTKKSVFGLATFSRYPIVKTGDLNFRNKHIISTFTDLKIGKDTLRIFNVHLQSVHFAYADYNFLDSMASQAKFQASEIISIFKKLRHAFSERAAQVNYFIKLVEKSPHRVIICGDFNDSPVSYAYRNMKNGFKDAFMESGWGFGSTYTQSMFPFRIDYILHDKSLYSSDFQTININLSDHYPIHCQIHLP